MLVLGRRQARSKSPRRRTSRSKSRYPSCHREESWAVAGEVPTQDRVEASESGFELPFKPAKVSDQYNSRVSTSIVYAESAVSLLTSSMLSVPSIQNASQMLTMSTGSSKRP